MHDAPIVYRLGHQVLILEIGVRFPVGVPLKLAGQERRMFNWFFKFATRLCDKCNFLRSNLLVRMIDPYYVRLRVVLGNIKVAPDPVAADFYAKNKNRVESIVANLTDEQSKNTFLGIIKYRQSYNKKDYPLHNLPKEQYFIDKVTFGENEVFIDCGAYDGDTIDTFVKRCPRYKHIVAFEPDTHNFSKLSHKHGNNPQITLINAGVYDYDGEVRFCEQGAGHSKIGDENGNVVKISVKTIDNLNLSKVTFLKMDIEGAELNALKGAEKTIVRDKPKLAVCIYHSNDDMLRIHEYIHALVPEYQFYIRHYGYFPNLCETVLYAVIPS